MFLTLHKRNESIIKMKSNYLLANTGIFIQIELQTYSKNTEIKKISVFFVFFFIHKLLPQST